MELDLAAIGIRIQEQRKVLKLTQQQIYEKIDITQKHYSNIENGHCGMSFEVLVQLSEILNISTDYILTGNIKDDKYPDFVLKYNKLTDKQKRFINDQIDRLREFNLK